MKNTIFFIALIIALGCVFALPITKTTEGWKITKKEGFTGLYSYTLEGNKICWKVPEEIQKGKMSELIKKSGLNPAELNAELSKIKNQELKENGVISQQVDMSKDGCLVLDKTVKKYQIGGATVEFTYGNITISVDMLENTDRCIDCYTDYLVCSDGVITRDVLDAVFKRPDGETALLRYWNIKQYRNYTYYNITTWETEEYNAEKGEVLHALRGG